MRSLAQRIYYDERSHRALPWAITRPLVRRWADRVWHTEEQVREHARWHMRYLLGESDRALEVEGLSQRYVEETYLRLEGWFRPWRTTKTAPGNVALLQDLARTKRGVVLNFMHHGDFHGPLGALGGSGIRLHGAFDSRFFAANADALQRQIVRTTTWNGASLFTAAGSRERIRSLLLAGEVVALASDVPGSSPVRILGREVLVSSGAARLAHATQAWVVPMTSHKEDGEQRTTLHGPLDPTEFDSYEDLLAEMVRLHEPALLVWPEGLERPLRRWAPTGSDVEVFGRSADTELAI